MSNKYGKLTFGFTLLEVLISLIILSFFILGFTKLQIFSLHQTRDAYHRFVAIHQLDAIRERLKALKNHRDLNEQINQWNLENQESLPQAKGRVMGSYPNYQVRLEWGLTENSHYLEEKISV